MLNRSISIALAVVAVFLVPVLLFLALRYPVQGQGIGFALWAPIVALFVDAALFYLALGAWNLTQWERIGISVILPLLIAIASWASMMGMVSAPMPQEG